MGLDSAAAKKALKESICALLCLCACSQKGTDESPTYALRPDLPETTELGQRRGWRIVRGIVHLHSVYSHDACDGMPMDADGKRNLVCAEDLRHGLCVTRQDFAMTTDHEEFAAAVDFSDLLLLESDDQVVTVGDQPVANLMDCGDGFHPLILPGGEFGVMPVGMTAHVSGSAKEREKLYEQESAENVEALRNVGAVVLQAHLESKDVDLLGAIGVDGVEVWNLHAAIDPSNRELLSLDPFGAINAILPFSGRDDASPHPDLALLGFLEEQQIVLEKWDALLAQRPTVGVAATDAHENAFPIELRDGERGDSYRRMMRWFSNHLLVPSDWEAEPEQLKEALLGGRAYVAFEVLGTPVGFDYVAVQGETVVEMGGQASAGAELVVTMPTIIGWDGPVDAVLRLIHPDGSVTESAESQLRIVAKEAGPFRAEVWLTPYHLEPYLGAQAEKYLRPYIWIYTNAIRVE